MNHFPSWARMGGHPDYPPQMVNGKAEGFRDYLDRLARSLGYMSKPGEVVKGFPGNPADAPDAEREP